MSTFKLVMKIIGIAFYSMFWFALGMCTIVLFFVLTPPWNLFKEKSGKGLDSYTKEAIYHDTLDD